MIYRTLLVIFLITLMIIILGWYFSDIVLYITSSLVLSTLLRPLTNRIVKVQVLSFPIPRFFAVLISFLVVVGVISLFVTLFIPLVSEQISLLSNEQLWEEFEVLMSQQIVDLENFMIGNNLVQEGPGFINRSLKEVPNMILGYLDFEAIFSSILSLTGNLFITTMAVSFITFFFLYEDGILRRQIIGLIPNQFFEVFIAGISKVESLLSNYLIGLMLQMLAIFSLASIGLTIVGVKYAVTIAVFAAVANLIPYLGPILGALFGIFVGISTAGTFAFTNDLFFHILKIVTVFSIVQVTDNVVLQPLIFSRSVKAHPLEIFVIIFAGATIAGITGMIAAIPVYTIIRVSAIEIKKGFKEYHIFKVKKSDGPQMWDRRFT